jgi:DNA-binding MarR family transcriptional regulator
VWGICQVLVNIWCEGNRVSDEVLSFLVRHAWLGMRAAIEDELRRFDLTVPQFATLLMLGDRPGMSPSEVARACGSTRQAANQMVAALERDGLVTRSQHPTDRRTHALELTDPGRARLALARPAVHRREDQLEAAIPAHHRTAARQWMAAVATVCATRDPTDEQ